MGRTGGKVQKGSLGAALLRTQKKSSSTSTSDIQSRCASAKTAANDGSDAKTSANANALALALACSAGKHVSARDGGDATVALASYLEGSSLVRLCRCTML